MTVSYYENSNFCSIKSVHGRGLSGLDGTQYLFESNVSMLHLAEITTQIRAILTEEAKKSLFCFYFYRNSLRLFSSLLRYVFKLDIRMVDLLLTAFEANLVCSLGLVGVGEEWGNVGKRKR